jgi:hypothetical protein
VDLKGTQELMPPHGRLKFKKAAVINIGRPLSFGKEIVAAAKLDKESREYHNLCGDVAKRIEEEVRKLSKENGN